MMLPTRFTVNSFMRWLGFTNDPYDAVSRDAMTKVIELTNLGLKHFRFTRALPPTVFSDTDLQAMQMPPLLLMGEYEVIYDATRALYRARRLVPHLVRISSSPKMELGLASIDRRRAFGYCHSRRPL